MRIDRAWFREMTESGFRQAIDAAIRFHRQSYGSGEPARKMEDFMAARGHTLGQVEAPAPCNATSSGRSSHKRRNRSSASQTSTKRV